MARAGGVKAPRPFQFRGCDLTAEYLRAMQEVRVRFPATAPFHSRFPSRPSNSRAAESPKLSLLGAAPRRPAKSQIEHIYGVVADKQCTCFASKLMWERYPPTPPFYRGENEIQASLISSASVGATPTPATIFQGSDPAA